MNKPFKLLIGYDGSPCADAALNDLRRAGLPQRVDAVVMTVADVFTPPEGELAEDELVSPNAAVLVAHSQDEARKEVQQALAVAELGANRVRAYFPAWEVKSTGNGDSPAWALINLAAEVSADLVVVGSHGHASAGGRLILGSTSLRVLYEAECSVRVARCADDQRTGPVRIVIGFDGSKEALAAVDAVASRSWPNGSAVRVITALDASRPPNESNVPTQKLLAAGLTLTEIEKEGEPAQVLVTEAAEWSADVIFVGTRNLHGFRHLLEGSVSSAVAASAQCSVEVIRASHES